MTSMSVEDPEELPSLFAARASAGDLQGLLALYEEGAMLVGPDGEQACGAEAVCARLEGLLAMAPQIVNAGGRALVVGDIALMSNSWRMTLSREGQGSAAFEASSTEVARRQPDGGWLYVIDDPASAGSSAAGRLVLVEEPQTPAQPHLPFIDAHSIEMNAPPEDVWDELAHGALRRFGGAVGGPLGPIGARLLGCPYADPPGPGPGMPQTIIGFRIARAERPSLVELAGEHRYSSYSLTFRIEPAPDAPGSLLTAETRAVFPGARGRRYRALVIGSGGHVIVVRLLLGSIRRRAERGVYRGDRERSQEGVAR